MTKFESFINSHCPNGVAYKPLEDCCIVLDRQRKPVTSSARVAGEYPTMVQMVSKIMLLIIFLMGNLFLLVKMAVLSQKMEILL